MGRPQPPPPPPSTPEDLATIGILDLQARLERAGLSDGREPLSDSAVQLLRAVGTMIFTALKEVEAA